MTCAICGRGFVKSDEGFAGVGFAEVGCVSDCLGLSIGFADLAAFSFLTQRVWNHEGENEACSEKQMCPDMSSNGNDLSQLRLLPEPPGPRDATQ